MRKGVSTDCARRIKDTMTPYDDIYINVSYMELSRSFHVKGNL